MVPENSVKRIRNKRLFEVQKSFVLKILVKNICSINVLGLRKFVPKILGVEKFLFRKKLQKKKLGLEKKIGQQKILSQTCLKVFFARKNLS